MNSVRGLVRLETGCEHPGLEFSFPLGVVDPRSYCKSVRLSCFSGLCEVGMSGACTPRRKRALWADDRVFSLGVCRCQTSARTMDGCGSGLQVTNSVQTVFSLEPEIRAQELSRVSHEISLKSRSREARLVAS